MPNCPPVIGLLILELRFAGEDPGPCDDGGCCGLRILDCDAGENGGGPLPGPE